MKYGDLGGDTLVAGKEMAPYRVEEPALAATVTVSFCNRNRNSPMPALVQLAYGPGTDSSAAGTKFLEFDAKVKLGTPLERTGIALSRGDRIFVMSDTDLVDVAVYGYEKG